MAIELESDRIALGADETAVLAYSGNTANVPVAAMGNDAMDAAPGDVDDWIEALVTDAQITALGISEGVTVTLDGDSYRVAKIEHDNRHEYGTGGFNVVYLDPP